MKLTMALALVTIAVATLQVPAAAQTDDSPAALGFARLAALAGEWAFRDSVESGVARRPEVVTGTVAYELVSNGTTIQERVDGPDHGTANMVSMIRVDGHSLVLDHFCSSGTQPRLVSPGLEGNEIRFVFEGGTSIPTAATGHIHAATFTFGPDGSFQSAWTWAEPGNTHVGVRRHGGRRDKGWGS